MKVHSTQVRIIVQYPSTPYYVKLDCSVLFKQLSGKSFLDSNGIGAYYVLSYVQDHIAKYTFPCGKGIYCNIA